MRRMHGMPFGAEVVEDGVRFRLWAPAAVRVELLLADGVVLPMPAATEGWYELVTDQACAGSAYRYRIDGKLEVPDPASRYNPGDVHGSSEVIDPCAFAWHDEAWRGRPWEEAVLYELHVGSFSARGDFAGVAQHLDHLAELGVTAVELMPVADFPGTRNWGYDGVLPFAPDSAYGRPEDLKRLIQAAHDRGLMVLLDVVYNHFGPEGNYLHAYAPAFFTERHHTPWGAAINFDDAHSRTVRDFFIHNALYWLEEYHLDGLRLDAVHAIRDDSEPHILDELRAAVARGPGAERHVHLVLENDANSARFLRAGYSAQWNDDAHHAYHVLLTGERDGYYADYADAPLARLGRCLAEGFAYQGEASAYRGGERRGEPSADLPATRFVSFLQNHDQIGNRALGERLTELAPRPALKAAVTVQLLAPNPPLLFMGEEWGSTRRFPFFCDFGGELAQAVTEGRRREFEGFARFRDPAARAAIPDPSAEASFEAAVLDWEALTEPEPRQWLGLYRHLLKLRREDLIPRLPMLLPGGRYKLLPPNGLAVCWRFGDGSEYNLIANLGDHALLAPLPDGEPVYLSPGVDAERLPPWSVAFLLETRHA